MSETGFCFSKVNVWWSRTLKSQCINASTMKCKNIYKKMVWWKPVIYHKLVYGVYPSGQWKPICSIFQTLFIILLWKKRGGGRSIIGDLELHRFKKFSCLTDRSPSNNTEITKQFLLLTFLGSSSIKDGNYTLCNLYTTAHFTWKPIRQKIWTIVAIVELLSVHDSIHFFEKTHLTLW